MLAFGDESALELSQTIRQKSCTVHIRTVSFGKSEDEILVAKN
jgi:hypothetical protein